MHRRLGLAEGSLDIAEIDGIIRRERPAEPRDLDFLAVPTAAEGEKWPSAA
jgi:hypothetical protein